MKFVLLILISIITYSCEKNDDLVAPPITQENTFSCKIDGELFVAQPHGGFLQSEGILLIASVNTWLLVFGNGKSDLYININNINTGGSLSLIHISEPTRRTPISYAVFC